MEKLYVLKNSVLDKTFLSSDVDPDDIIVDTLEMNLPEVLTNIFEFAKVLRFMEKHQSKTQSVVPKETLQNLMIQSQDIFLKSQIDVSDMDREVVAELRAANFSTFKDLAILKDATALKNIGLAEDQIQEISQQFLWHDISFPMGVGSLQRHIDKYALFKK